MKNKKTLKKNIPYYLPNSIDLNGPYQAALYKIDIEKTLNFDKYKGEISIVN